MHVDTQALRRPDITNTQAVDWIAPHCKQSACSRGPFWYYEVACR